jgi:hypothetical protein
LILEARLEGAIKRGDPLLSLRRRREDRLPADLIATCSGALGSTAEETEAFLRRVEVRDNEPARNVIRSRNLSLVVRAYPDLSGEQAVDVCDRTIALIEGAMSGPLLGDRWPDQLFVGTVEEEAQAAARAKCLNQEVLAPVFDGLAGRERTLLARVLDPSLLGATALEQKLVAAGAADETIQAAKEMRARATLHIASLRARTRTSITDRLDDVDVRLLTIANAIGSNTEGANAIWLALLDRLQAHPGGFDPNGLFDANSFLLAGQLCQLSDECQFAWRG